MQDEEIGGAARRRVKEHTGLTEEQRDEEIIKNKIKENSAEPLDKFMEYGRARVNKNRSAMLEIIRKRINKYSSSPSTSPIR